MSISSIDCATCLSCEAVCPKQLIKFVSRWNNVNLKSPILQPVLQHSAPRRRFLFGSIMAIGGGTAAGAALLREHSSYAESYPVRPSGCAPFCNNCGRVFQARCQAANVRDKKLLTESAIKVAGPGKEDRIITGSYKTLRLERINRTRQQQHKAPDNEYLPDFLR